MGTMYATSACGTDRKPMKVNTEGGRGKRRISQLISRSISRKKKKEKGGGERNLEPSCDCT